MKNKINTGKQGFTLVELLVVISIIGLLASLAFPALSTAMAKAQMTQGLSNAKQLQLAAMQAGLDATVSGSYVIAWPGDVTSAAGVLTVPATSTIYFDLLGKGNYLSSPNVCAVSGIPPAAQGPAATPPDPLVNMKAANNAFNCTASTSGADDNEAFIISINFDPTGPAMVTPTNLAFSTKGFVIVRKAGDGNIYTPNQVAIGTAPNYIWGENPAGASTIAAILKP